MLKAAIQGKKKDLEKAHGYDIQENEELDVFMWRFITLLKDTLTTKCGMCQQEVEI